MLRASKQKGDQAGECGLHKYLFDGLTSFIAYEERCALVKIMWCLAVHHTCGGEHSHFQMTNPVAKTVP